MSDLNTLGLCEHCNDLISFEDFIGTNVGDTRLCKHCHRPVTDLSFGYETTDRGSNKVRCVGPSGTWINIQQRKTSPLPELVN